MSKKYIKQKDTTNFFYPNYDKAEYDIEIIHDINNNCVSGDVTTFSATTISSSSITFTISSSWSLNGATPWIKDSGELMIYSIHMLAPNQVYYKPWRMVENRSTITSGATTYSETGVTFTVTNTQAGVNSFTNGDYYFEIRFIGHDCTYNICLIETLTLPTPTPTPSPSPTPTPSITPTLTPTPTITPSITPSSCPCTPGEFIQYVFGNLGPEGSGCYGEYYNCDCSTYYVYFGPACP